MCINRQSGISFVELIMFIMIVSIGIVGILPVLNNATSHSSDPVPRKQAIAIAESLLEEIELQPFTFCDPSDPNNSNYTNGTPLTSSAQCTGGTGGANDEGLTPLGQQAVNAGKSRYSNTAPYNNVSDYAQFPVMSGIRSIEDGTTIIPGLGNYTAQITITKAHSTFGAAASFPDGSVLQIAVRVTGPAGTDVTLTGYRFRYAPNAI
jgi:MSHA pilin protein MshD